MKQVNLLLMSAAMTLAACGGTKDAGQAGVPLIERSNIKIEGKRMTPEALWAMGRIGGVAVSPDEKQIAYTVAYYSVPENKKTPLSAHRLSSDFRVTGIQPIPADDVMLKPRLLKP